MDWDRGYMAKNGHSICELCRGRIYGGEQFVSIENDAGRVLDFHDDCAKRLLYALEQVFPLKR